MSPEFEPLSVDHLTVLERFHRSESLNPDPDWIKFEAEDADWKCGILTRESRQVIALRTTPSGVVDAYLVNLDNPSIFQHVLLDGFSSVAEIEESIKIQRQLGMTAPNQDDLNLFYELIDQLALLQVY